MNDRNCSAATLISVIRAHFPLDTQQSESEANDVVAKSQNSFGNVNHLHHQGFFDASGDDQTANMHKDPRPKNVCFLSVKFDLPMGVLGLPFSNYQRCMFDYFLRLPQSSLSPQGMSTTAAEAASVSNASERKSLFSTVTNLNSKFISTPVKTTSPSKIALPYFVNVIRDRGSVAVSSKAGSAKNTSPQKSTDSAAAGKRSGKLMQKGFSLFGQSQEDIDEANEDNESAGGNNPSNQKVNASQNSNNSFDTVRANLAPKTAELLASLRTCSGQYARTYYGALDILDDQSFFDSSGV